MGLVMSSVAHAAEGIEVQASEFVATRYLSADQQEKIRQTNRLAGNGEADYAFSVSSTGWYELWVEAPQWATDLLLDGDFLSHTPFASGVWEPDGNLQKTLNLHLAAGRHTLRFIRTWHPGLSMRRFVLRPASSGPSAIIGPGGRIFSELAGMEAGAVTGSFTAMRRRTIYTRAGWLLPYACQVASIALLVAAFLGKRRRESAVTVESEDPPARS